MVVVTTVRSPLREKVNLKQNTDTIASDVLQNCQGKEEEKEYSSKEKVCDTKSYVQQHVTKALVGVNNGEVSTLVPVQRSCPDQPPQATAMARVGKIDEKLEDSRTKRKRKSVDRLTLDQQVSKKQSEALPGTGVSLRNIPNVSYKLSKVTGKNETVEALHLLMYRRKGTAQSRKKHVLDFSGLSFTEDDTEKEIESRMNTLNKMNLSLIHDLLDVLDIKRGQGDKQAKIELILSFLKKPKQLSEISLEQRDVARREKAKRKRSIQEKKKSAKRNSKRAQDTKKKATTGQVMGDESTEDQTDIIPLNRIKDEIHTMLEAMTNEEFTTVTTKMIMTKLSMVFQCDMRPRKTEVKEIAKAYAQDRLS